MGGEKPPPVASSEFFDNLPVPSSNPTFFGLRVNLSGLPKVKNGAVLLIRPSDKQETVWSIGMNGTVNIETQDLLVSMYRYYRLTCFKCNMEKPSSGIIY